MADGANIDIQGRIRRLVGAHLHRSLDAAEDAEDLHLDSMALLELIVRIEKEFGVSVDEEALDSPEHFRSIATLAGFVATQMQA